MPAPDVKLARMPAQAPLAPTNQVTLVNPAAGGHCLDVKDSQDGVGRDGTPLQIWDCTTGQNQEWSFEPDGTVHSLGMCMDVAWGSTQDGAAVQLATCSGNPAQQWVATASGELKNPQSGKCLDAVDHGTANGTALQTWTCTGAPNQQWEIHDRSGAVQHVFYKTQPRPVPATAQDQVLGARQPAPQGAS